MKAKGFAVTVLLALAACSQPQPPISRIDRVKPGDNALTCVQLAQEIGEMNKVLGLSNEAQGQAVDQSNTTGAVSATAGIGSALGGIPYVGSVVGLASAPVRNQQASNQMQAEQDAADAKARKENLVALANSKNCYAAAAELTVQPTAPAVPARSTKKK